MFDNLTSRLQQTFRSLTGKAEFTEANTTEAIADIRRALLEADVAAPVVKQFIANVTQEVIGTKINPKLTPEQAFVEIIYNELTKAMGEKNEELNLRAQPPVAILMAGLQGAGKTTSVAKLAKFLKAKKKKVLVVSADVYRPAAIKQLQTLALDVDVDFYPSTTEQQPVDIAKNALEAARKGYYDVLIVDTAGRLHVDENMMTEIKAIHQAVKPIETLFTVDAMTGQDAAITAKAFNEALPLTGVILTKLDGDARGGAALSIRQITGKPIKFLGTGEKTDALEAFHPDRIAGRILDRGDLLTLIENIKNNVSEKDLKKQSQKLKSGKTFTLTDFYEAMQSINKMGGMSGVMKMLPGMSQLKDKVPEGEIERMSMVTRSIIESMTPKERENPKLLKHSRKLRISKGCGRPVSEINKLLTQYEQMKQMQKMFSSKGGMSAMMRGLGALGGMGGLGNLGNMFKGGKFK